jgi:uncharacterized caspase-like protein
MTGVDPMYNLLNTLLDDKEAVIFLGAGASMEGKQNRRQFPGTSELVERVIKKFGPLPKTQKKRLDRFYEIIEKWEKEKKLSARLSDFLDGEPGTAHYHLAALSTALFGDCQSLLHLTTNYDDLMTKAFKDLERNPQRRFKTIDLSLQPNIAGLEFQEDVSNIEAHIKEGRPAVIKLFGNLNSQSPIFRQRDMKFQPEVEKKLIQWMQKPMIVIGYSFSDAVIVELLIASRGTAPVFLVNPSAKIPAVIKNLDRVHHIKRGFSGFISDLLVLIKERKPETGRKVDNILDFLGVPVFQQDPGPVIEAAGQDTVSLPEKGLYTNSWALVAGINRYKDENIPDLNFTCNDARAVASCLPALGFPGKNIKLLVTEENQVTREAILDILETQINPYMKEDDRFVFYFSGHGVSYESNKLTRGYILMQDSTIYGKMPSSANPFLKKIPARALEMQTLLQTIQALPCKHKLVLIDSCFSGFMAQARGIYQITADELAKKLAQWTKLPVTHVLTAGRSGQKAEENDSYRHGVFTRHLLDALAGNADSRGDGVITFLDLAGYTRDRTARERGSMQDPQAGTFGEGQFIFLYKKEQENQAAPPTDTAGAEIAKTHEMLFGRDTEMGAVISLLSDKNKPSLLNIHGLGGVGKTSLVREMVENEAPGQGVWLTAKRHYIEGGVLLRSPMTESITLQHVYRKIAANFGRAHQEELAGLKEKQARIQWLRNLLAKEKRLVVVDNFETIDEDFEQFLEEIKQLFSTGPSRLIITSRFDLNRYTFVQNYKLEGLSEGDCLALFTHELTKSGGSKGISIDKKMLEHIYAVTRGLPLAIKLIAARVRCSDILALDHILERLENIRFADEGDIYETFYKFIYMDIWNSLSDDGKDLLVTMTALAPGEEVSIPYLRRLSDEGADEPVPAEIFWKSFEEIKTHSLVDARQAEPSLFSLHPLTQFFVKATILEMDGNDEFKTP